MCIGVVILSGLLVCSGCSRSPDPETLSEKSSKAASKNKTRKQIYDERADARVDIQAAINRARQNHKRVLVKFGGNWCGWCHKLHALFHDDPVIAPIIRDEYELVLVDSDRNRALMERLDPAYGEYGYPWLAVFDEKGALLVTQETGVLETGNKHDVEKVKAFLVKWKTDTEPKVNQAEQNSAGLER